MCLNIWNGGWNVVKICKIFFFEDLISHGWGSESGTISFKFGSHSAKKKNLPMNIYVSADFHLDLGSTLPRFSIEGFLFSTYFMKLCKKFEVLDCCDWWNGIFSVKIQVLSLSFLSSSDREITKKSAFMKILKLFLKKKKKSRTHYHHHLK